MRPSFHIAMLDEFGLSRLFASQRPLSGNLDRYRSLRKKSWLAETSRSIRPELRCLEFQMARLRVRALKAVKILPCIRARSFAQPQFIADTLTNAHHADNKIFPVWPMSALSYEHLESIEDYDPVYKELSGVETYYVLKMSASSEDILDDWFWREIGCCRWRVA